MKKRISQILPWFIAVLIFYFLFRKIPPQDVLETLKSANWFLLISLSLVYFVLMFISDCISLKWAFSRFITPIPLKETILMRSATYLLMVLNYNLGQAGMALYLKRVHKASFFKALSVIFYLSLIDLGILIIWGMISLVFKQDLIIYGKDYKNYFLIFGFTFISLWFLWQIFWTNINHPIFRWLNQQSWWKWWIQRNVFIVFKETNLKDFVKAIGLRVIPTFIVILSYYLCVIPFQSHLELIDVIAFSPLILIASSVPITPGGLGTVQILSVELFSPLLELGKGQALGVDEILFSSTLIWMFINLSLKALFGFTGLLKKSYHLFISEDKSQ